MTTATLEQRTGTITSAILPEAWDRLDYNQRQIFERLNMYEAPFLEQKLRKDGKISSTENYRLRFTEFKKYAGLATIADEPLAMTSPEVDDFWHQFILFTRAYETFCRDVLGTFLHHEPETTQVPVTKESRARFFKDYKTVFGRSSDIWSQHTNKDGACGGGGSCNGACGTGGACGSGCGGTGGS